MLNWLFSIIMMAQREGTGLWGPLSWLDYGRGPAATTTKASAKQILHYIDAQWEALGGSPGVAYLIDAALAEVDLIAQGTYGYKVHTLLDHNGNEGRWIPLEWRHHNAAPYNLEKWPESFRRPWEGNNALV